MKLKFKALSVIVPCFILLAFVALTREAKLRVGDPAPRLQAAAWGQGEPISAFELGKVYVVEFWATWCGPCRASIPHLNDLHIKFKNKGLIVLGQNVWEPDESAVAPFVKTMGDAMSYRVALDDRSKEPEGAMVVSWLKAAKLRGIPAAFVINKKGRIAWIGHPMELDEQVLIEALGDQ